jgi:hypothetical protein
VLPPALVARDETVGIDDCRAALALAHMAAEREGLFIREPALDSIAVLDNGRPEDEQ